MKIRCHAVAWLCSTVFLVCGCADQGSVEPQSDNGPVQNEPQSDNGPAQMTSQSENEPVQEESPPIEVAQDDIPKHGIHDETMVLSSGETLRYTIAIPKVYDGKTPTSLIVGLHYGGRVSPHYATGFLKVLIAPGLEKLKSIIIAPDSLGGGWDQERNERAILELMDATIKKYNIDENKTLLTGFSMGGHGTWHIGSRHQDRFSAMIPIAGNPMMSKKDIEWTTPIYAIHSRADRVVPIGPTEKFMKTLVEAGSPDAVFVAVDDLPHFETNRFVDPLKDAVPWVQKLWSKEN